MNFGHLPTTKLNLDVKHMDLAIVIPRKSLIMTAYLKQGTSFEIIEQKKMIYVAIFSVFSRMVHN